MFRARARSAPTATGTRIRQAPARPGAGRLRHLRDAPGLALATGNTAAARRSPLHHRRVRARRHDRIPASGRRVVHGPVHAGVEHGRGWRKPQVPGLGGVFFDWGGPGAQGFLDDDPVPVVQTEWSSTVERRPSRRPGPVHELSVPAEEPARPAGRRRRGSLPRVGRRHHRPPLLIAGRGGDSPSARSVVRRRPGGRVAPAPEQAMLDVERGRGCARP